MDLKFFMTYYIMFPLINLWLVKSFILKKFLTKKEIVITRYAPPKFFYLLTSFSYLHYYILFL